MGDDYESERDELGELLAGQEQYDEIRVSLSSSTAYWRALEDMFEGRETGLSPADSARLDEANAMIERVFGPDNSRLPKPVATPEAPVFAPVQVLRNLSGALNKSRSRQDAS